MVMIHGRGATASDILALTIDLAQPGFAYLAPQAANNTWYPNRFLEPIASNEPWLSSALAVVEEALARVAQANIPPRRTILLGSPFILEEILAQMRADAVLAPLGDGWQLDATRWMRWRAAFTLPETTYDLVAWRLANLSTAARHLLDVLAVAGRPLPFMLLSEFPNVEAGQG